MPITRVGVQAVTGSTGQVVDIDPARISATITNVGAVGVEYSTNSGSNWTSIAASGSASLVTFNTNEFRLRRATAGGYPTPVDIEWTAQSEGEANSLTAAQAASVSGAANAPGTESTSSANSSGSTLFGVRTASADTSDMSFTRTGGNATVMGHDGYFYACQSGELRMTGSRRVENLLQASEALEAAAWTKTGGVSIGKSSKYGSRGRKSLRRLTVAGSGQTISQTGIAVTGSGRHLVAQMFAVNGATISILDDGTQAVLASSSTLVGNVISCAVVGNTSTTVRVVVSLPAGVIELGEIQLTESCSVTSASEYVARGVFAGPRYNGSFVDGVEYFHNTASKGVRVEPGMTNSIRQSRNLAAAQWSPSNCSAELVTRDSPFRGMGGVGGQVTRLYFSSGSSASRSIAADWQGTLPTDNTWICAEVYMEPGTATRFRLVSKRKDGTFSQAYFNLTTLTVGTLIDGGSSTPQAWITRLPSGLLRLTMTHNVGAGATAPSLALGFSQDGADNNNVSGTQEVFIHHCQLTSEINSSPIITTSAAASRAVDALSVNMVSPYGAAGGFQVSMDYTPEYPSNYLYKNQWYYLWYTRSDATNRLGLAVRPGPRQASYFAGRENNFVFDMYPNSATWDGKHYLDAPTISPGSTARVVSGLSLSADGDGSECRLVVNDTIGTQAGTATTSNPATLPTSIQIGADGAGNVYHAADYSNIGLFGDLSTTAMLSI